MLRLTFVRQVQTMELFFAGEPDLSARHGVYIRRLSFMAAQFSARQCSSAHGRIGEIAGKVTD
jgi:hypothetical protein